MNTIEYPDGTVRTVFRTPAPSDTTYTAKERRARVGWRHTLRDAAIAMGLALSFMTGVALLGMHAWFWKSVAVVIVLYIGWGIVMACVDARKGRRR